MQNSQPVIAELENGKRPHVEADTVYRFCRALGCTSDYFVGLTDDPRLPTSARHLAKLRRRGRRTYGIAGRAHDLLWASGTTVGV